MCSKAREFALALAILECAIKPVAMLPIWKDSLGHTRYTPNTYIHVYMYCTYYINVKYCVKSLHIQIFPELNQNNNSSLKMHECKT